MRSSMPCWMHPFRVSLRRPTPKQAMIEASEGSRMTGRVCRSPWLPTRYQGGNLHTEKPHLMQFHLLSFEGPDEYARAGGIASRITGLSEALAAAGFETHLWFVGDPHLPGHEAR